MEGGIQCVVMELVKILQQLSVDSSTTLPWVGHVYLHLDSI